MVLQLKDQGIGHGITSAYTIIFLMGLVSLFGDVTYEGARSVAGPFLYTLGASASVVGLLSGAGEFLGYALRLLSGYLSDRLKSYWLFTFLGYGALFGIPLLAFAGRWEVAAFLLILERLGKGIRTPARDVILSQYTYKIGRGWAFGIHEALDQVGAFLGPIIFGLSLFFSHTYKVGFYAMFIPAILCMGVLVMAWERSKGMERRLEDKGLISKKEAVKGTREIFWLYMLFSFFTVMGLCSFQLMAYHFKTTGIVPESHIPLLYAIAMAVDAGVALIVGKIYDKRGLLTLLLTPALTLPIPFFAFSHSYFFALLASILWGCTMGIHETIMRAAIADLTPYEKRGMSYGIFHTMYGGAWLVGSGLMGLLYEHGIFGIYLLVTLAEIISIPIILRIRARLRDVLVLR